MINEFSEAPFNIFCMRQLYLFFISLFAFTLSAQSVMTLDAIQDSIYEQLILYPQEKIHLHTDRTQYMPGEKIFFKVYVVDAFTLLSPTTSEYAYVELINSSDELIQRVMIRGDENDLFHGQIFLSDFVPEGDYTIRAYTRYMENMGDDYFFKKPIRISNLKPEEKRTRRQSNSNYDVSFFPEGGYLTEGVFSKLAFKALSRNGMSEPITCTLVDRQGNKVGETSTVFAGMGQIGFLPEQGKEYYMECKNESGQKRRIKLPDAQKTVTLSVNNRGNRYMVEVKKSPDIPKKPLSLLVHCKGAVLYYEAWNTLEPYIVFPNDMFPSGVIQFVLFDEQMNPVSERLVFNKTEDQTNLTFSLDKSSYSKREKVVVELTIIDSDGDPAEGHLSVAVTDDQDMVVDYDNTILASLLLSSELKGYIESPGYYLQEDASAAFALDLLMLTHGWRRYDISEVFKGNYALPEKDYEEGKSITGSVKTFLLQRPIVNGEVILLTNHGEFQQIVTDSTGSFRLNAEYPERTRFFIQTRDQKGSEHVELVLDKETFPQLKHVPRNPLLSISGAGIGRQAEVDDFLKKAEQRALYDDDMRLIQLPDVVVIGNQIAKRDLVRLEAFPFNEASDQTIYREDFENMRIRVSTLIEMFSSSVKIDNGIVYIRGYDKPAIIVIDGIIQENMSLGLDLLITIDEVETVDIFKGASGAIFGTRGGNGAISFSTRRGVWGGTKDVFYNKTTYSPLGYQEPVEFYSPQYDTQQSKQSGTPDFRTTIFWKPDVLISEDGKATFDFYTSDFPNTYSVVIEGMSYEGKIIRRIEKIQIK